jgi:hypothetical protein
MHLPPIETTASSMHATQRNFSSIFADFVPNGILGSIFAGYFPAQESYMAKSLFFVLYLILYRIFAS